jgi:hypothetical protein
MRRPRLLQTIALAAVLPLLGACENSATAYVIDTSQHALILVREQPFFWKREVEQAMIASRLPHCQRKVTIHPGARTFVEMEVFEAGDRLWALRQGERWYLAGTDRCQVQDWENPGDQPPGPLVGSFQIKGRTPTFTPVSD